MTVPPLQRVSHHCGAVLALWTGDVWPDGRLRARALRSLDGGPYRGPLRCLACQVMVTLHTADGQIVTEDDASKPTAGRVGVGQVKE